MTTFYLDEEILMRFKEKCHKEHITMSKQVELCLKEFTDQPEENLTHELVFDYIDKNIEFFDKTQLKRQMLKLENLFMFELTVSVQERITEYAKKIKERYKKLQNEPPQQKPFSNREVV